MTQTYQTDSPSDKRDIFFWKKVGGLPVTLPLHDSIWTVRTHNKGYAGVEGVTAAWLQISVLIQDFSCLLFFGGWLDVFLNRFAVQSSPQLHNEYIQHPKNHIHNQIRPKY